MNVQGYAWLAARATRAVSDILLGCLLAMAAAVAIAGAQGQPFAELGRIGPWAFPAAVGYGLATTGAVLFIRGCLVRSGEPGRWSATALLAIVGGIAVVVLAARQWGGHLLLL